MIRINYRYSRGVINKRRCQKEFIQRLDDNLINKTKMVFIILIWILLSGIFMSGCIEKSTTGSVYFSSEPSGAEIWIEGVNTGNVTPSILHLHRGNYTYSLIKEDYVIFIGDFNIEIDQAVHIPQTVLVHVQPPTEVSVYQLKYHLLENVGTFFYCDPDYYPVAREGIEQKHALEQYPDIQNNTLELQAILDHADLMEATSLSAEQKLLIYQEHKKLNAIQLSPYQDTYEFKLRISEENGAIFEIEGYIDKNKSIDIVNKKPSFPCPICLSGNTLIDTPNGNIAVKMIHEGMTVWTIDASSSRIPAKVLETVSVPTPPGYQVIHLVLDDGRELIASPTHQVADGRPLGSLMPGDTVDRAKVSTISYILDGGGAAYDILPAGDTGLYWASGIPVQSTLLEGVE